jgi:hypothetical protein
MTPAPRREPASSPPETPIRLADAIEPLWTIDDICIYVRCSRRWVEGQRSAGRLPRPDAHVGRCPRWRPESIRRWIETGGRR